VGDGVALGGGGVPVLVAVGSRVRVAGTLVSVGAEVT